MAKKKLVDLFDATLEKEKEPDPIDAKLTKRALRAKNNLMRSNLADSLTLTDGSDLQATIASVLELWRQRQAWHRAEKSLILQSKSLCRRLVGGDKDKGKELYEVVLKDGEHPLKMEATLATGPLVVALEQVSSSRKEIEKRMENLAQYLPGYQYCIDTPGLSAFTIASLTAECAGVNNRGFLDFDTISRVFKRMSVHCLPDGTRARLLEGVSAVEAGYAPKRRSVLWTIGDSLVKAHGPYRDLYLAFKSDEEKKANAKGLTVIESAKIPKGEKDKYMSKAHVHNRAKRRMEKELLRNIWVLVRTQYGMSITPPATTSSSDVSQESVPLAAAAG